MPGPNFLLEIGVEEIPDWMIPPALEHLRKAFTKLLEENRLRGKVEWVDATPRRLVLAATGLPKGQKDSVETVSGPPKSAGEGAAQGFARKLGVTVEQLETLSTPKGEYFSFQKKLTGRAAAEILADALPGLILSIPWPKAMYWSSKASARFIRPIRWVVALFGSKVVPFEVAGVVSSNISSGHRRFGKAKVKVSIRKYEEALRANGVLVHAAERRAKILEGIAALVEGRGLQMRPDAALLETLTYLTEWPTAILGSFDAGYLSLPSEVLVTVMRHHQKYFSVTGAGGALAPNFVAVMNVPGDPEGLVVAGNERVLRARFNDARFFWESDQKRKISDRVASLGNVTFQAKLGSYLDKTNRVVDLVKQLGGNEHAQRAALLAKCDLTTDMVKEFTDLQGVVGGLYMRAQGESEEAAAAVYDHYKPLSMEDTVPGTVSGLLVSLADKLDTLRECFRIGMIPSGSRDPFALRRAAQGVVKILLEGELDVALRPLLDGNVQLEEFFLDRIRYYFREIRGFAYDEVNAVLAAGWDPLPGAESRLRAIQKMRPTEDFEPLAASFKRISNIIEQAGFEKGIPYIHAMLEAGPEADLCAAFEGLRGQVASLRASGDDAGALARIASVRPAVDLFFDKVLVNSPDPNVRRNRLALLSSLLTEFSSIADFSEIVTS
ncbi:MAG: glycine--tRNA ligase subunit beta [Acidobacteriia bacterium]|nr:glycine--tRNA ligase subunit beta [Terriglobia bacterium]